MSYKVNAHPLLERSERLHAGVEGIRLVLMIYRRFIGTHRGSGAETDLGVVLNVLLRHNH